MGQLSNVPESSVLPKCDVIARVADFKEAQTQSGKKMYKLELRIVDDGAERYKNAPIWEMFVIGSDKDPQAEKDKTWMEAVGARNMKRLFKKLGLDTTKEVDDLIADADGQEVGISIIRFIEPDTVKRRQSDGTVKEVENQFAGQPRNRITNYWTPGEKSPQIYVEDEEVTGEREAAPKAPAAKKAAAVEDEDSVSPKAPKPAAVEASNGADPDASANGHAEVAAKPSTKKEKELPCPECQEMVAKSTFMDHIATHESA